MARHPFCTLDTCTAKLSGGTFGSDTVTHSSHTNGAGFPGRSAQMSDLGAVSCSCSLMEDGQGWRDAAHSAVFGISLLHTRGIISLGATRLNVICF